MKTIDRYLIAKPQPPRYQRVGLHAALASMSSIKSGMARSGSLQSVGNPRPSRILWYRLYCNTVPAFTIQLMEDIVQPGRIRTSARWHPHGPGTTQRSIPPYIGTARIGLRASDMQRRPRAIVPPVHSRRRVWTGSYRYRSHRNNPLLTNMAPHHTWPAPH